MVSFTELIQQRWATSNSLLCVGLDPDPERLPEPFSGDAGRLFAFNREIIDATAAFACAFKPQIAYYAAHRAEEQLEQTIRYIVENYPEIPVR